jgi:hypothetical protein
MFVVEDPMRVSAIMKQLDERPGIRNEATVALLEMNAASTTNPSISRPDFTVLAVNAFAPSGSALTASRTGSSP